MRARLPTLITMFGAAAVVMLTLGPKPAPSLVWNASESVPIGLYRVRPSGKLTVTNLVVLQPPEPLATFLADGGYLPRTPTLHPAPPTTLGATLGRPPQPGVELARAQLQHGPQ